jgi:hypothetical protein
MITGSSANVAQLAAYTIGCTITGPAPYTVTFGPVVANPAATPTQPAFPTPLAFAIPAALATARETAALSAAPGTPVATLFEFALLDYLRNGGT